MFRALSRLGVVLIAALSTSSWAVAQRTTVHRLDGPPVKLAQLVSIDGEKLGGLDDDGQSKTLDLATVVAMDFGRTLQPANADVRLRFFNGDVIDGVVIGGDEQFLELEHRDLGPIRFDIESIGQLEVLGNLSESGGSFRARDDEDTLYLYREGGRSDVLVGVLESFSREGLVFESLLGSKRYRYSELVALALPPLGELEPPEGTQAQLALKTGGRLSGRLIGVGPTKVKIGREPAGEIEVPLSALLELSLQSDRFTHLSDLDPIEVLEQPAFGDRGSFLFPFQKDRSVTGGPLRLGGRVYLKGLGVHSRCRLVYDLGGKYQSFQSRIGVDDSVLDLEARGSVIFRVLLDGKTLYESEVVQGGSEPVDVPALDVEGGRRLELIVDFASDYDIADRADWVRPILIKS
ncbi:MAG: NPCBM/NEW2 domain-containing protein [Planctomycetota bacterium]